MASIFRTRIVRYVDDRGNPMLNRELPTQFQWPREPNLVDPKKRDS
jgi:hypothetical protein